MSTLTIDRTDSGIKTFPHNRIDPINIIDYQIDETINKMENGDQNLKRSFSEAVSLEKDIFPEILNHRESLNRYSTPIFVASKTWEGFVVSKSAESFIARLKDSNDPAALEEEAELPIADVPDDDLNLIEEGSAFYFSIGYYISECGAKYRSARILFQRLPNWSSDDVLDARKEAEEIHSRFNIE